jgi:hypothetical protein
MKNLLFLILLFSISSCKSQNETDALSIGYEAITRGSSIEIRATSNLIHYEDVETEKQFKPTKEDWKSIESLIEEIELSEMQQFKAPSEESFVDAALQATLSISINNKTYRSERFDHGNPPEELKKIIEKLFDLISE